MSRCKADGIDCRFGSDSPNKRKRGINELASGSSEVSMISKNYEAIFDGEEHKEGTQIFTSSLHGSISVIGRRRAMEDAVKVVGGLELTGHADTYDFFAVYDGHGGATVANACRERMHELLTKEMEEVIADEKGLDWHKVMSSCFMKMDKEVGGGRVETEEEATAASEKSVGSTAVVVIVGKKEIVVANCGDSRAILCRRGVTVPLSRDHKVIIYKRNNYNSFLYNT